MPFSDKNVIELTKNSRKKIWNTICAYCGSKGEPGNPLTDDHVVAENFVPRGLIKTGWYLEVRACERCNREKGRLEDDIPAITQLPDVGTSDNRPLEVRQNAVRKAKGSISVHTKKPVAKSYEKRTIEYVMPGVQVRFVLLGPPHIELERVWRLAEFHLKGFFHFITYDEIQRIGAFPPGDVLGFVNEARRSDWGNPQQRWFADLTSSWRSHIEGTMADGYFRVAIRRDPSWEELWSFGLEWNKALRIVGFFGDLGRACIYAKNLPPLDYKRIDATHRHRREIPLDPKDDSLFLAD